MAGQIFMRSTLDYCLLQVNIKCRCGVLTPDVVLEKCVCVHHARMKSVPAVLKLFCKATDDCPQKQGLTEAIRWTQRLLIEPERRQDSRCDCTWGNVRVLFKGIFHLIMKTLSFIQFHVIPNLYNLLSSVKHKSRSLAECSCCSLP